MAVKPIAELASESWNLRYNESDNGVTHLTIDRIQCTLLWQIREELRTLNRLLGCTNFTSLPREIRAIKREVAALRKAKGLKA